MFNALRILSRYYILKYITSLFLIKAAGSDSLCVAVKLYTIVYELHALDF